jgi:hypothetical protein
MPALKDVEAGSDADEDAGSSDLSPGEGSPQSTPRSQHGESKPIGPGPAGETQTDDQDNLNNNVSNLGD